MSKQRALALVVELAPFALTPSGLFYAGLVRGAPSTPAPVADAVLLASSFDTADFDHPLAVAHAHASALFASGDWSESAVYFPTGWRYSAGTDTRPYHELVMTVAMAMTFTVPFLQHADLRRADLHPSWLRWDSVRELSPGPLEFARPGYDAALCREVATAALLELRAELQRHPERLANLFAECTEAQAEASLLGLYPKGELSRAAARRLLSAATGEAAAA